MGYHYEAYLPEDELIKIINAQDAMKIPITTPSRRRNFRRGEHGDLKPIDGFEIHSYLECEYVGDKVSQKGLGMLPSTLMNLLHGIGKCVGDGWTTNASQDKIAGHSHIHINSVGNGVRVLRQLGLIRVHHNYDFVKGVWQRVSSTTVLLCAMNRIKWLAKKMLNSIRGDRDVKPVVNSTPNPPQMASALVNTSDVALFLLKDIPANSASKIANLPPDIMEAFKDFIGVPA